MDGMAWPLLVCGQESLYTVGAIECRRCGRELMTGDTETGGFDLATLLQLIERHAPECPACT